MTPIPGLNALKRAQKTAQAAQTLFIHANEIAYSTMIARSNAIVVALVSPTGLFAGTEIIERERLQTELSRLEESMGQWVLVLETGISQTEVEAQCSRVKMLAEQRARLLQSYLDRHDR